MENVGCNNIETEITFFHSFEKKEKNSNKKTHFPVI